LKKVKSKKQNSQANTDMFNHESDMHHRGKKSLQPTKRFRKQDLNWLDDEY